MKYPSAKPGTRPCYEVHLEGNLRHSIKSFRPKDLDDPILLNYFATKIQDENVLFPKAYGIHERLVRFLNRRLMISKLNDGSRREKLTFYSDTTNEFAHKGDNEPYVFKKKLDDIGNQCLVGNGSQWHYDVDGDDGVDGHGRELYAMLIKAPGNERDVGDYGIAGKFVVCRNKETWQNTLSSIWHRGIERSANCDTTNHQLWWEPRNAIITFVNIGRDFHGRAKLHEGMVVRSWSIPLTTGRA